MKLILIALAMVGALLTAAPASAQYVRSNASRFTSLRVDCCRMAEAAGVLHEARPIAFSQGEDHRAWRYAVWGGLAGAAAGGLWGYALHANAEDWVSGSSAFLFTVPVGILAGGLGGAGLAALTR